MNYVDGERLRRYRVACGLTQAALGAQIGVTRQTVAAWEGGVRSPTVQQLLAVSRALGAPLELLIGRAQAENDGTDGASLLFRADQREELSPEMLNLLRRRAADYESVERLLDHVPSLPQARPLTQYAPEEIEQIAHDLREWLGITEGPLGDTIGLLEAKGLKVILCSLPERVSGFSGYADEQGAVIFVNQNHPAERQYFTVLHELAHLVLHRHEYRLPDVRRVRNDPREASANHLAGALLLPRETIRTELRACKGRWIPEPLLLDIKLRYWVSMRTVLFRAHQSGLITKEQMGRQIGMLNKTYGSDSEPGTVPGRQGLDRLTRLTYTALVAEKITMSRAAEILAIPLLEVQDNLAQWLKGGSR